MDHNLILPVEVNSREPTCLAAFLVMARAARVDVSPERARQVLSGAGVPWEGSACDWNEGLTRTLTVLTHPQGVHHG